MKKGMLITKNNIVSIKVNKEAFSFDSHINYQKIVDTFSDFDLISVKHISKKCIQLKLKRLDYTHCEDISNGLNLFSIGPKEVKDYCKITKKNCLCLSECWLPYAWSVIRSKENFEIKHLTIIHIDDHSDLMSPLISYNGIWCTDLLTQQPVKFDNPDSIKSAVKSGAITIGSMLTPIINSVENVKVVHLKQDSIKKMQFKMTFESVLDSTFYKKTHRLNINYLPIITENQFDKLYIKTSEISDLFSLLDKHTKILLHIDMDYFNNRFNGSTSWKQDRSFLHDPDLEIQKKVMLILCNELGKLNKTHHIDYVFLGMSPSFYPVEFWRSGLSFLFQMLIDNGIDVRDISKFTK